jgi:hypothetical protein
VERVKRFGGHGLTTYWKSNAIAVFDVDNFGVDSGDIPLLLSGGIFDVRIDSVPEPATGLLAILVVMFVGLRRSRR